MHAGVQADPVAITEHGETGGRIEFHTRGAGVERTHFSLAELSSIALEATLEAAATISSRSRSSPSKHSCGIETIECSNSRSATGHSIATVSGFAPASSTALRYAADSRGKSDDR